MSRFGAIRKMMLEAQQKSDDARNTRSKDTLYLAVVAPREPSAVQGDKKIVAYEIPLIPLGFVPGGTPPTVVAQDPMEHVVDVGVNVRVTDGWENVQMPFKAGFRVGNRVGVGVGVENLSGDLAMQPAILRSKGRSAMTELMLPVPGQLVLLKGIKATTQVGKGYINYKTNAITALSHFLSDVDLAAAGTFARPTLVPTPEELRDMPTSSVGDSATRFTNAEVYPLFCGPLPDAPAGQGTWMQVVYSVDRYYAKMMDSDVKRPGFAAKTFALHVPKGENPWDLYTRVTLAAAAENADEKVASVLSETGARLAVQDIQTKYDTYDISKNAGPELYNPFMTQQLWEQAMPWLIHFISGTFSAGINTTGTASTDLAYCGTRNAVKHTGVSAIALSLPDTIARGGIEIDSKFALDNITDFKALAAKGENSGPVVLLSRYSGMSLADAVRMYKSQRLFLVPMHNDHKFVATDVYAAWEALSECAAKARAGDEETQKALAKALLGGDLGALAPYNQFFADLDSAESSVLSMAQCWALVAVDPKALERTTQIGDAGELASFGPYAHMDTVVAHDAPRFSNNREDRLPLVAEAMSAFYADEAAQEPPTKRPAPNPEAFPAPVSPASS